MKTKSPVFELYAISHRMNQEIRKYSSKYGLNDDGSMSRANIGILLFLHTHRKKEIFQKDIEAAFSVRRSTVSSVLSTMEKKGFIERKGSTKDKRLKQIVITEKAENQISKLRSTKVALEKRMIENIDEDDLNTCITVLNKMFDNLRGDDL